MNDAAVVNDASATYAAWAEAIGTWASAVIAVVATILVYQQLKSAALQLTLAVRSFRSATFGTVLTLEAGIAQARAALEQANTDLGMALHRQDDDGVLELLSKNRDSKLEQYLNLFDRLCASIRRGLVPEREYRSDYRDAIRELIAQHSSKFGADTRHHNMLAVHRAWAQDVSAVDSEKLLNQSGE